MARKKTATVEEIKFNITKLKEMEAALEKQKEEIKAYKENITLDSILPPKEVTVTLKITPLANSSDHKIEIVGDRKLKTVFRNHWNEYMCLDGLRAFYSKEDIKAALDAGLIY